MIRALIPRTYSSSFFRHTWLQLRTKLKVLTSLVEKQGFQLLFSFRLRALGCSRHMYLSFEMTSILFVRTWSCQCLLHGTT